MIIRDERPQDAAAIAALIEAAFADMPHSDQREAAIVAALREDGALVVSLVAATGEGAPAGHIAFSPVRIAGGAAPGWYGLGPVAVRPDLQGQGIGSALVRAGLGRLGQMGAAGCVLLGEPEFYGRFGFAADPRLTLPGVPPAYFQVLALGGPVPEGTVAYHPAFGAKA